MLAVLITSNIRRAARFTGLFAGALMAIYIVAEAPYSGMSMNPARTVASAVPAQIWTGVWLYFAAPLLGMALAGEIYLLVFGPLYCAKLHHDNDKRCIFHHAYEKGREAKTGLLSAKATRTQEISDEGYCKGECGLLPGLATGPLGAAYTPFAAARQH
jgi:aquaporin Z